MKTARLADLLLGMRRLRAMTLREVAVAAGVSDATVSHIERGLSPSPALSTVLKIAAVLEVNLDDILNAEGFCRDHRGRVARPGGDSPVEPRTNPAAAIQEARAAIDRLEREL